MPFAVFVVQKNKRREVDPPCLDPLDYGVGKEPAKEALLRRGRVGLFETKEMAEQALRESLESSEALRANAKSQFDFLILECVGRITIQEWLTGYPTRSREE